VGSAKPVPNNNTPEGQSKNRHVELNFSAGKK
jgi:outer membrane protein OmpA-like peptidoglycan-associated protein